MHAHTQIDRWTDGLDWIDRSTYYIAMYHHHIPLPYHHITISPYHHPSPPWPQGCADFWHLSTFSLEAAWSCQVPPASLVISQAGVVDLVSAYEANLGQGAVRDFLGSSAAWMARFFVEPSAIGGVQHGSATKGSIYRACQFVLAFRTMY